MSTIYQNLKDIIENQIEKFAKGNFQYVMLRYLLLENNSDNKSISIALKRYNQESNVNFLNHEVYDALTNPRYNVIVKQNNKYKLLKFDELNEEERYDLVLSCDKKIDEWLSKGHGTVPYLESYSFKDAALEVLKEYQKPLHYVEITNHILSKNLMKSEGKTPHFTLVKTISQDIEANKDDSDFAKTSEGIYTINYKFSVLEIEEEIKKFHTQFLQKLSQDTTKSDNIRVASAAGSRDVRASWIKNYDFWWYSDDGEKGLTHYWNVFGIGEPEWNSKKPHSMICQINQAQRGRDRSTGGLYLKNKDGEYFLAHNGSIGGGSPGVGKWNFQNFMYYSKNWIEVIDNDKKTEWVLLVSKLDDPNFLKNIKEFINKADEFKRIPDKEKYLLNPEKFEKLHGKFLKYIYDTSIGEGYTKEEATFVDFSNKYLVNVEISDKNKIADNARNILEIEKWNELKNTPGIITEKLKQICDQKISKPLITAPRFGNKQSQAQVLYKLESNQIPDFEKMIFNLFLESTEEETFSKNFDGLIEFLVINKLAVNSQFLAYIAFIADKEKYIPIRMREFEDVLKYYENYSKIPNFSWKRYNTFLTLIKALKAKLSEKYPTPDTIEAHSYLWVVSSILKSQPEIKEDTVVQNLPENKNDDFEEYFKILENKNQFIFYGPPGTGKTWKAGKIAKTFIEKSQVYQFSASEYEEYVRKSLASAADSHSCKTIIMGNDRFIIKNSDIQIRGKFVFIESGKQNPDRCNVTLDEETMQHLSGVEDDNRFIIIINDETRNFLVIRHKTIKEKFKLSGDQKAEGSHSFIVNVGKDSGEFLYPSDEGEGFQDCSELLHNFECLFNKDIQPCQFFEKVTFHQTFSYEDFIEGIRPEASSDNRFITYPVKPGIFKKICNCAKNDLQQRYVLLVDEINRGNISKILGELITLLEKDKRGKENAVRLPYSKEMFEVPPNLYIIGTMNTADRSLVKLDIALRRRFAFVELMPNSKELDDIKINGISVRAILEKINQRIKDHGHREYQIGHSYFMPGGKTVIDITKLQYIFAYEIIPLLKEYFFDNEEKLQQVLKQQFIDWDTMTVKKEWQQDESVFMQNLEELMK